MVGGLEDLKKKIRERLENNMNAYKPILDIIEANATDRLDAHCIWWVICWTTLLYKDDEVVKNPRVMEVMFTCMGSSFPMTLNEAKWSC